MTETENLLLNALDEFEKEYKEQYSELKNQLNLLEQELLSSRKENKKLHDENIILDGKLNRLIELLEKRK